MVAGNIIATIGGKFDVNSNSDIELESIIGDISIKKGTSIMAG
jgi:hypothetical protein